MPFLSLALLLTQAQLNGLALWQGSCPVPACRRHVGTAWVELLHPLAIFMVRRWCLLASMHVVLWV